MVSPENLEQSSKKQESAEFSAIGFHVGSEEYGLRLTAVQEIVTLPHITRVPNSPDYVKGVINLHGNVVPVIDIARRFQIGATDMVENSRVVIVENKDETVGFLAEGVSTVSRFESVAIQPPPPLTAGISSEFLEGVVRVQDRFLIFLDLERILSYEMTTLE